MSFYNMLILSQLRNVASFVHSLQEKKRRKRKKVHLFILITKNKKESYSFIHSFLARKAV